MNREKPAGYNSSLASEVAKRLKQLSFLCNKIHSYEKRIDKIVPLGPDISLAELTRVKTTGAPLQAKLLTKDFDAPRTFLFEFGLFVESFYFVAWKICSIVKHKRTNTLPYLNTFEAIGIRNVRNCLIEHPEKEQVFMQSFMCGGDKGPVLKNARPASNSCKISDKGLWVNAEEFKNELEKVLRQAVEH